MREIKFRAWDKKHNDMVYFTFDDIGVAQYMYKPEVRYIWNNKGKTIDLNNKSLVMQYTSLKDKNNKEIYEGDIFKLPREIGVIKYHKSCFVYKHNLHENCLWGENTFGEVISNIYENPELLK